MANSAFNLGTFEYDDYSGSLAWTGPSSPAPSLGDAVIVARYVQVGGLVHYYGSVTFGASSTFGGTGGYRFSLPVNATANMSSGDANLMGSARLYDTSVANWFSAVSPWCASATTFGLLYGATYGGTISEVTATAPFTFAQGDVIGWNLTYEAA